MTEFRDGFEHAQPRAASDAPRTTTETKWPGHTDMARDIGHCRTPVARAFVAAVSSLARWTDFGHWSLLTNQRLTGTRCPVRFLARATSTS